MVLFNNDKSLYIITVTSGTFMYYYYILLLNNSKSSKYRSKEALKDQF